MKIFLSLFIFLTLSSSLAQKGMITVLEAPLLILPDLDSTVLETKRRGELIHIHKSSLREDLNSTKFYLTLTRDGQDAYISKDFIKIIYKDTKELKEKMVRLEDDPTDYRLSEPLPNNYPLENPQKLRAGFNIIYGSGLKQNYMYAQNIEREDFSSQMGISIWYSKKVDFDKTDRLYFGFNGEIISQQSEFLLVDDTLSSESQTRFSFGPLLRYDVFRNYNYKFSVSTGLKGSYHRHLVSMNGDLGIEERSFSGLSFGGNISGAVHFRGILPSRDYEIILGADVNGYLPYSLKSSTPIVYSSYWNEQNDTINYSFNANASLYFGVLGNY